MKSTRERLIEAATRLLDEGGLGAVTLREVGRLAGLSHNAPYKHFADKEHLLAAIAARELGQASAQRRRANGTDADAARRMMLAYVRWAMRYPARFKLTFGSWSADSIELSEAADTARAALIDAVSQGQASGQLPAGDPERVAALIHALAHGAADLALSGHLSPTGKGRASPDDLVNDLFDHLATATIG